MRLKLKPFGDLVSTFKGGSLWKSYCHSMTFTVWMIFDTDIFPLNMGGIRQDIYPLQFNTVEKLYNCRLLKLQLAIYYIADSRGVIGKNVTTTTSHIGENFINKLLPFGRNGLVCLACVQN